ncbi:MAG: hypothetical protein KIT84_11365 [Labilithrix sp.]|nr:hypothetical protein [Labilithrix sp.]MCW5811608.1 hypothetical protein [Labilithrix sp.]
MALILPSNYSLFDARTGLRTYADATRTEGGRLAKYVMAQFRSDSELAWIAELRRTLATDELKWQQLKDNRPKLRAADGGQLWARIEKGISQATLIVMDPSPTDRSVRRLLAEGGPKETDPEFRYELARQSAAAIVLATPIAHLPYELDRAIPWSKYTPLATLDQFTPERIVVTLAGGSLKSVVSKATVFAARAHAIFDVALQESDAASTRDVFRSPLAKVLLTELLSIERVFDEEEPSTLAVLNAAADEIAANLQATIPSFTVSDQPLVKEVSSRAVDELQAADLAAGWARELLDLDPSFRRLADKFERVVLNGTLIKGSAAI